MNVVGPLVCPVLVGRDDLLALAGRRLEAATGGQGHVLFLAGEAGIGKTRLLGSIERRAEGMGIRVARGGTYPGDLEVPGAVFLELARAMQRTAALEDAGARIADRLAALDRVREGGDAHRRRRLLTLDIADDLATAASGGPTLLALEDLHQADDLTLEVIATIARRAAELPLVIVGTYRSDELYPRVPMREWRSRLLGQRQAEEARLRRLTEDETATMVSLILAEGHPAARDIVAAIHDRTDGIPLHVEELIALIGASGTPVDRLPEPGPAGVPGVGVPDTLESAILGRVGLRSDQARTVARIGSVIGRSFEFSLLADVVGDDPDALATPLAELADHFLLAAAPASGRYGFRHALICDAIYGRIPDAERQRLHARVASVAAARGDFSDAFLSSQYERAGQRTEAFETALRASRAAAAISAHREAFDLCLRAMRNVPPELEPGAMGDLQEEYGGAAAAVDDNATAAAAFEEARRLYLAAGRDLDAAAVVVPLVAARHLLGDDLPARAGRLDATLDEVRLAAGATEEAQDPDEVARTTARIEAGLAAAYMLNRHLDEAIAHAGEARRLAASAGDDATAHNATVTLAACLPFAGRVDEGFSMLEATIGQARAAHAEAEASRGYRMLGSCASVTVEYERGERYLREGIDYAERTERWNDRHYMAAHLGHVLWATGRWAEARSVAEQALQDGRGGITTRITALHVAGYVALGRGEWAAATAALEEARVEGERMGELQRLSPALWGLAEAALLQGDTAAAVRWSDAGLAASSEVRDAAYLYPFAVTGTRARLLARDPAGAARFTAAVEEELRLRSIPGTLPAIDHARGLLALAAGQTGEARRNLERAADAWDGRRRAWEAGWARLDLARTFVRSNRRADGLRLVAEVEARAAEMGSEPLAGAARAARGRTGGTSDETPWSPLTGRELEVATLLADGLTNGEIARQLGVSPKTVSAHVEHILAKLGVGRRTEVAAWVATLRANQPSSAGAGHPGA